MLGMYEGAVRFCNNRFENIGFLKSTARVSTYASTLPNNNWPHNPFKSKRYLENFGDPENGCVYTNWNSPGGEYWAVDLDGGGELVHLYSVTIKNTNNWATRNQLNGARVYLDTEHCATISGVP